MNDGMDPRVVGWQAAIRDLIEKYAPRGGTVGTPRTGGQHPGQPRLNRGPSRSTMFAGVGDGVPGVIPLRPPNTAPPIDVNALRARQAQVRARLGTLPRLPSAGGGSGGRGGSGLPITIRKRPAQRYYRTQAV